MGEQTNVGTVFGPFQEMWNRVLNYLPSLAAGILILLLGAAVCWIAKGAIVRLVLLLRLDRALRGSRWAAAMRQADVRHAMANVVGNIFAAFLFLVFLENAILIWKLEILEKLIGGLVRFFPKLIVGGIILLAGSAAAAAVASRVRAGLAVEGLSHASLIGRLVHWGLMIVVVAFALEELAIAPRTLHSALTIGLGSLGLVAALAFGLGSRGAVAHLWRSLLEKPRGGSPT